MSPSRHAEVIAVWLASNDSRDKLIKGAGCFFKLLGVICGEKKYIDLSVTMSDCRSLMRLFSWLNNTKKIADALASPTVGLREVIFLLRLLFEGVFSLLDNVVYTGHFFPQSDSILPNLKVISRASLFWGYVAAVVLDIHDLVKDKVMPNRTKRYCVLIRNLCDLLSTVENVFLLDIGVANTAFWGLLSAIIASKEQLEAARQSLRPRLGSRSFQRISHNPSHTAPKVTKSNF